MKAQAGFTLLETLIALMIFGILLLLLTDLFRSSLSTSSAIDNQSELLADNQLTQQVLAGRLTDAIYVYPAGTTMTLSGTGQTTLNTLGGTNSGTQNWTVGTNPFVAMILPPLIAAGNCNTTVFDGCYRLFAYYPMLRSSLIANVTGDVPKDDVHNGNQWVMMEYRKNLVNGGLPWVPGYSTNGGLNTFPSNGYIQGASGRYLADYFQPNSLTFAVTAPTTTAVGKVDVSLASQRLRSGSTNAASVATHIVTIYPRNWKPI